MKAEEFDKKFDNDEDSIEYLDLSAARRPGRIQRKNCPTLVSCLLKFLGGLRFFRVDHTFFWWKPLR